MGIWFFGNHTIFYVSFWCSLSCYFCKYMYFLKTTACFLLHLSCWYCLRFLGLSRIAKDPRFERLPCTHKGTYADDCLVERVTQVRTEGFLLIILFGDYRCSNFIVHIFLISNTISRYLLFRWLTFSILNIYIYILYIREVGGNL